MSNGPNRHGLTRPPSEAVRREIRQRCGFGCVICGLAFYDYEHFDPEFADAKVHDPAGMTLLCSQCNQKKARGRLSAATVAKHNASPRCLQDGFASELFDFGTEPVTVQFGGVLFHDCRHLLVVNGVSLMSVAPPRNPGEPMRVSAKLTDRHGRTTLTVKDNVFQVRADAWDVECVGPTITFRNGKGDIALVVELRPPHAIAITRIEMVYAGIHLRGNQDELKTSVDGVHWHTYVGINVSQCRVGIQFENGPSAANDESFEVLI